MLHNILLVALILGGVSAFGSGSSDVHPPHMLVYAQQSLAKNDFVDAARWSIKYYIRLRFDAVCSKDLSAVAGAQDQLTFLSMAEPKFKRIFEHVPKEQYQEMFAQEFAALEHRVKHNDLPSPYWITAYGMNKWLNALSPDGTIKDTKKQFVSLLECRANRLKLIDAYKQSAQLT